LVNRESLVLNNPAAKWFKRKQKCTFSTTEFHFSAGALDVLAYDRKQKCFHVAEGKLANRVASVGHAVGQLIAYISMLQENGFDFLNRISKEANLYLTDFTSFLENKAIKVCFYIILPDKQKEKILRPAKLMLNNIGDFGESIGILTASKNKCILEKSALPINIKIRKIYNRDEFLGTIRDKFLHTKEASSLEDKSVPWTNTVQFIERKRGSKKGNPYLHFEVWAKRKTKKDKEYTFEIAFHLEWGSGWQKDPKVKRRADKIRMQMWHSRAPLRREGFDFHYKPKWGKAYSKLFATYKTKSSILDDEELSGVLSHLSSLTRILLPKLNKIHWGRTHFRLDVPEFDDSGRD